MSSFAVWYKRNSSSGASSPEEDPGKSLGVSVATEIHVKRICLQSLSGLL